MKDGYEELAYAIVHQACIDYMGLVLKKKRNSREDYYFSTARSFLSRELYKEYVDWEISGKDLLTLLRKRAKEGDFTFGGTNWE